MRMKRYFEQVASGGSVFGFFCGGRGLVGVVSSSNLGWNRQCRFYGFWAFFPSLCRQVRAWSLKLDKDYLLLQSFHFIIQVSSYLSTLCMYVC